MVDVVCMLATSSSSSPLLVHKKWECINAFPQYGGNAALSNMRATCLGDTRKRNRLRQSPHTCSRSGSRLMCTALQQGVGRQVVMREGRAAIAACKRSNQAR